MRSIIVLTFLLNLSAASHAQKTEVIAATGVFKEIDVVKQNKALDVLFTGDDLMKRQMMTIFFEDPNSWNPPVIYSISELLFELDYKDDAVMWFYIGQLRARCDANFCQDESARGAVGILNDKFGPMINKYAFKDLEKLEVAVNDAIEFVREYEPTYDQRWINLHGMWAIIGIEDGKQLSYPKDEWAAIKKKTTDEYYAGFVKHVLKK